jgi:predicted nucleotidyltransferase
MAYDKSDHIKTAASALRRTHEDRLGVVLSGHVRNGKLVLDQETLDEIAKKYPDADRAFVAMNSPFDSRSLAL